MLSLILFLLIVLWLLGLLSIPLTHAIVFVTMGRAVTLNDILVFLVVLWLIGILPYPFREIASVLLLLWVLAAIGIIAVGGFSQIVLIALIIGVIGYMFKERG